MINALTSSKEDKKVRGNRILKNVEQQLAISHKNRLDNFELDGDLINTYKVDFNS